MAPTVERPPTVTKRYYARDQASFIGKLKFTQFNRSPERAVFPLLGTEAQPDVIDGKLPISVGAADPETREREAFGVVASSYEPIEIRFDKFVAPVSGRYKLRLSAYSFTAGTSKEPKWYTADRSKASPGRRAEPVTLYSSTPPRQLRLLGSLDFSTEPTVQEMDTYLLPGESIRPDAARLFRSRPPSWHNPLATKDGIPGVAFKWLEVEGPIFDQWPTAGHRLLFGDLPLRPAASTDESVDVVSKDPHADAERLLTSFMAAAYRGPVPGAEVKRFMGVVDTALASGARFTDAMITAYSAVLCSPAFLTVDEKPGRLDGNAVASRLALFLWNSSPDETLRKLAASNQLNDPQAVVAQADRLLADPRSRRFVDAFLDYWLDLRKIVATAPDASLYPDYYLDDLLSESAEQETQLFFNELVQKDLPASNIVWSGFAMLNERLATHYGIPGVEGVAIRRVELPEGCVRGGLMTQASVLKVTANGTTTSPVVRGAWIMERVLGKPPPPPPPSVPAIDPDIRGATTIRQQLEKHRSLASCAACHAKIDPAGLALESFDVLGGWRDRYRAMGDGPHEAGFGHNGQPFAFHVGPSVDPSGVLPDGRRFEDIQDLKSLLLDDSRQVARNLVGQLVAYGTGAPIRFGDREAVERILDHAQADHYRVRGLIREIVKSDLFLNK